MLRLLGPAAIGLADFAHRLGIIATNAQLGGSIENLRLLSGQVPLLTDARVPHQAFDALLSKTRSGAAEAAIANDATISTLLALEGRIWGALVERRSVPPADRQRFAALVKGEADITVHGVLEAHRWIRGPFLDGFQSPSEETTPPEQVRWHVKTTPLLPFEPLAKKVGRPVFLKVEGLQRTGSLKIRGATALLGMALMSGIEPAETKVVTASTGNHAEAVITAARNLRYREVEVVLPSFVPPEREGRLRRLGATVHRYGETIEQAEDAIQVLVGDDPRALFVPRSHPAVAMGLATLGFEIDAQITQRLAFQEYAVVAPAGGGGLVAGLGAYFFDRNLPVFGVQSEAYSELARSFRQRELIDPRPWQRRPTLADGIAVQRIGPRVFHAIRTCARDLLAVSEEDIAGAVVFMNETGFIAEGAAAAPIAALLNGKLNLQAYGLGPHMPVVVVHTGQNIELETLDRLAREAREAAELPSTLAPGDPSAERASTTIPAPAKVPKEAHRSDMPPPEGEGGQS